MLGAWNSPTLNYQMASSVPLIASATRTGILAVTTGRSRLCCCSTSAATWTTGTRLLAGLIPHARLKIYPDSAHGFLFQHHAEFAADLTEFLA
jgi:pimeloyl-ACP methyl ester carboxylesterase